MITADDVAKVVLDRLAAVAASRPGGDWFDRGPDEPAGYPYGVFKVEAGEARHTSGAPYTQPWTVRLAAYCPVGAAGVDPQAVQQAFNAALASTAANTALRAAALRNGTEKVLYSRVLPGQGKYDPRLRDGRDVFVCGLTVELMTQGDRSQT